MFVISIGVFGLFEFVSWAAGELCECIAGEVRFVVCMGDWTAICCGDITGHGDGACMLGEGDIAGRGEWVGICGICGWGGDIMFGCAGCGDII